MRAAEFYAWGPRGARGNNRYMGGGMLAHATQVFKDSTGKLRQRGPYQGDAKVLPGLLHLELAKTSFCQFSEMLCDFQSLRSSGASA